MEAAGECFICASQIKVAARSRKVWKSVVKEWDWGVSLASLYQKLFVWLGPLVCVGLVPTQTATSIGQRLRCYSVTILLAVSDWKARDKHHRGVF